MAARIDIIDPPFDSLFVDGSFTLESLEEEHDEATVSWSVDDKVINTLQERKQYAFATREPEEMKAINQKEGYGDLFSTFSTIYDGLWACAAGEMLLVPLPWQSEIVYIFMNTVCMSFSGLRVYG
jgi:hypothetical protein